MTIQKTTMQKTTIKPTFTAAHAPPDNRHKTIDVDIEYYQAFLDDVDIPDEQKLELIETLWQIVVSFVELGFLIHPNAVQDETARTETALSLQQIIRDFAQDSLDIIDGFEPDDKA